MRSIRWKLVATTMITVFIPIYFLNQYAVDYFDRFTRTALEKHMVDVAFLAGETYLVHPSREELLPIFRNYAARTDTRIRLLSPQGTVLLDTEDASTVGEDLSALPEVAGAAAGRYQARAALTEDRRLMYYYCAQPIRVDGEVTCIAYLSRHTNPIIKGITRMVDSHRLATGWALALAAAIAVLFAQTLTHRLRLLTRATTAFAQGDEPAPVRVRGNDEIGELAAAFNHLGDELAQREAYNRDFVSTTLHELRAPVTAIQGAAELLEQGATEKPEARARFLGNIRYQAERLMRLTGELAGLTRLEAESGRTSRELLDYPETMAAIVDHLRTTFDDGHARFDTDIPSSPMTVRMNAARIEQVIANLLENAFRYTPADGQVSLSVTATQAGEVQTTVRDTGPGISPSNLPKVFDRFFTTEPKDRYRGYGSGLGLAIAQSIVANHKGRMWVDSVPGEGTAFHFVLPLQSGAS